MKKFGGSSVASPERLFQVAQHVKATAEKGTQVVVVVSAMGKTTDELLVLARSISQSLPRRELDMLLTCGERISMALLAMALSDLGVPAISFTGSQSGILTNDRHSGARIIEVRPIRIQDELERGNVVIVAGFQGMSYKREITTLGRGGSDTTAVALAAALSAESCEIYSDVDGVYSADPRVVSDARHLDYLGYDEMQELAAHGAKVLNAQAVEWAQRQGIVIHARKTSVFALGSDAKNQPETETRIGPPLEESARSAHSGKATAVTGCAQLVEVRSANHGHQILSVLRDEGVSLRQLSFEPQSESHSTGTALFAAFVRDDLPDFERTLAKLSEKAAGDLVVSQEHGSVTAVGPGLGSEPATLLEIDALLRENGLTPRSYSTSPLRITVSLKSSEVARATVLLHDLLCRAQGAR